MKLASWSCHNTFFPALFAILIQFFAKLKGLKSVVEANNKKNLSTEFSQVIEIMKINRTYQNKLRKNLWKTAMTVSDVRDAKFQF